jgi:hypothetical protein
MTTNRSEHDKTRYIFITFISYRFERRSLHDKFDEVSEFRFLKFWYTRSFRIHRYVAARKNSYILTNC